MKTRNKKNHLREEALGEALGSVLSRTGWLIPTDDGSVAEAEDWVAEARLPLPAGLRNPVRVLSAPRPDAPEHVVTLWEPDAMDETLARAAREGGTLSAEVEKTMQRDREAAEREFDSRRKAGTVNDRK